MQYMGMRPSLSSCQMLKEGLTRLERTTALKAQDASECHRREGADVALRDKAVENDSDFVEAVHLERERDRCYYFEGESRRNIGRDS